MPSDRVRFLSCDWGTTHFRLRFVEDGAVRGEVRSDEGTAKLAAAEGARAPAFSATLSRARGRLDAPSDLPVVVSGMASSSIGWKELPYARLPFALDGRDAVWEEIERGVYLLSGLRSETDVMRGEETEALGLAAVRGGVPPEAVVVKPGTHSKHLQIAAGRVVGFQSYMTGELFDVLARQSVLRHSTDPAAPFVPEAFLEGACEGARIPLSAALFRVRTRQVIQGRDAPSNTSFLSGVLIGTELAGLARTDAPIVLCAGDRLQPSYRTACEALGLGGRVTVVPTADVERLSVLGQGVVLGRIFST